MQDDEKSSVESSSGMPYEMPEWLKEIAGDTLVQWGGGIRAHMGRLEAGKPISSDRL
jgi:hypothetical protein